MIEDESRRVSHQLRFGDAEAVQPVAREHISRAGEGRAFVKQPDLASGARRRPVRAGEEARACADPDEKQRHTQVAQGVGLQMHAPAPAVTALVEVRAADDDEVGLPVGALDGRAGQPVAGLVLAPAVHVEEVEGGAGDEFAHHPLDAPLDEVVTDVARLRIKVVNPHALLFRLRAAGRRLVRPPRA
jgi:hypothetical protein